jgi:CBS domain-containing protein
MTAIAGICNRHVVCATRDMTIAAVADLMRRQSVGSVVVVDERRGKRFPVGLVTDRDIAVSIVGTDLDPTVITAGDFMSEKLVIGIESDDLRKTLHRMRKGGVRRIPIVDAKGVLCGIVSADDVIAHLAAQLEELAETFSSGRKRGTGTRPAGPGNNPLAR